MRLLRAKTLSGVGVLGLAIVPLAATGSSADAPTDQCTASNAATGDVDSNLQTVLNEANSGDEIVVAGVCQGPFRVTKSITISGRSTYTEQIATLTGADSHKVIRVDAGPSSSVHLVQLRVVHGRSRQGAGILITHGGVTLADTIVAHNETTGRGGGIYNRHGRLVLTGATEVSANVSGGSGGGVFNRYGSVRMSDNSTVKDNTVTFGAGGGLYNSYGRVALFDAAAVSGNYAEQGAGIFSVYGQLLLTDRSHVVDNAANDKGGGVYSGATTVLATGKSVVGSNSAKEGAGLYNFSGTITLGGETTVTGNQATERGAGIFTTNLVRLQHEASVTNNTAQSAGGGIQLDSYLGQTGKLEACQSPDPKTWTGGITPNQPDDAPAPTLVTC